MPSSIPQLFSKVNIESLQSLRDIKVYTLKHPTQGLQFTHSKKWAAWNGRQDSLQQKLHKVLMMLIINAGEYQMEITNPKKGKLNN